MVQLPRSLIGRILMAEAVTIGIAALILLPLTISLLHRTARDYESGVLIAQASIIASGIRHAPDGGWHVDLDPPLKPIYETRYDGRAFTLIDGAGRVVDASLFASASPWRNAPRGAITTPFESHRFVGVSMPLRIDKTPYWVVVTQDQDGPGAIVDDVSRSFLLRYLAVLLPLLFVLPLLNSLAIRRFIIAITRASEHAADIGPGSLDVRLQETGLPSEIVPLVTATNTALARLQASFQRQAEFSGNVAHELRTPLATLRVELDRIEDRSMRDRMVTLTDRLSHVLSQLRDLASLESFDDRNFELFQAEQLAIDVVAEMAPRIVAIGKTIAFKSPPQSVQQRGKEQLVRLALINLIDNATRHTPEGTAIEVTLTDTGVIIVEDDGPGITVDDPYLLKRRFWRADHKRTDSAGIGLSIVQRIMDGHHGTLEIGRSRLGGARFALKF
jgi:two-component system OmpR family sensor kinase